MHISPRYLLSDFVKPEHQTRLTDLHMEMICNLAQEILEPLSTATKTQLKIISGYVPQNNTFYQYRYESDHLFGDRDGTVGAVDFITVDASIGNFFQILVTEFRYGALRYADFLPIEFGQIIYVHGSHIHLSNPREKFIDRPKKYKNKILETTDNSNFFVPPKLIFKE